MDADVRDCTDGTTFAAAERDAGDGATIESPRCAHSIIDVLFPAHPPEPKNARVVRLFDTEAARFDPQPAASASAAPAVACAPAPARPGPTTREAARALRRGSLLAAVGGLR